MGLMPVIVRKCCRKAPAFARELTLERPVVVTEIWSYDTLLVLIFDIRA